jgi:hypothetical protein
MPSSLNEHVYYTQNEWNTVDYFIKVVDFLNKKNIKTMIDAGGCTGEVTKILLEKVTSLEKAIIIEAVEENYDFICSRLNGDGTVDVVNNALFYGEEYISLGQCDSNVGGWSFQHSNNTTNKVKTVTLEEFPIVDFIKIDIEGAEKNVIHYSKNIHEIPFIEIEFHDDLEIGWKPFVDDFLPNHKVIFSGSPDRIQNVFLAKK